MEQEFEAKKMDNKNEGKGNAYHESDSTNPNKPPHTPSNEAEQHKGWLRKTGAVAGKTLAWDVIYRDVRRVRPRFPSLWKDLGNLITGKINRNQSDQAADTSIQQNANRAFTAAIIATLFSIFFLSYWWLLGTALSNSATDNKLTFGVMGILSFAAIFQASCYWFIGITLKRRTQASDKTGGQ